MELRPSATGLFTRSSLETVPKSGRRINDQVKNMPVKTVEYAYCDNGGSKKGSEGGRTANAGSVLSVKTAGPTEVTLDMESLHHGRMRDTSEMPTNLKQPLVKA